MPPRSDAPRWIVLEPGLRHDSGHQRAFALALPAVAAARGMRIEIYGGTTLSAEVAAATGAVPLFRTGPIAGPFRRPLTIAIERFLRSSRDMASDLAGPSAPRVGRDDIVLVPTAYPWLMAAIGEWLAAMAVTARPRLVATYHDGEGLFVGTGSAITFDQAQIAHPIAAIEAAIPRERFLITATNHPLCRRLADLTGRAVGWTPVGNPVERFATDVPAAARGDRPDAPRIAIVGAPRREKGAGGLARLVGAIRARCPEAPIFVQSAGPGGRIDPGPGVTVHDGELADDAYRAAIVGAAIVVLPYNAVRYRGRVSGVFVDAVAAGCITVAPAGTWMAERIRAGRAAGVSFERDAPAVIAAAVARAIGDLEVLSARAAAIAPRWRAAVGPGPYVARIERLLADLPRTIAPAAANGA
ncbi:MAG: hypothetical protein AB7O45_12375 [Alphaproteobacteria bacterium]